MCYKMRTIQRARYTKIGAFDIKERFWYNWTNFGRYGLIDGATTEKSGAGIEFMNALEECAGSDRRNYVDRAQIGRILRENVALSTWCCGAYELRKNLAEDTSTVIAEDFLNDLERAHARAGISGILDLVFDFRQIGLVKSHDFIISSQENILDDEGKQRLHDLKIREKQDNWLKAYSDLLMLVLSHIALFPMPVQIRVLYGCDQIHASLRKLLTIEGYPSPEDIAKNKWRQIRRGRRQASLNRLHSVMTFLMRLRLIIKVTPRHDPNISLVSVKREFSNEKFLKERDVHHSRYTVQHQLRDYLTHKMGLPVPDQGIRNYFQVSIYSDQPKDLPTPSARHYRLFRELVTRQISQTRNTIWCVFQVWKKDQEKFRRLDDNERLLAVQGLARRLLDGNGQLDPNLPSLQAASHRVRAIYGLLRDGFSVGAISRLPGFSDEQEPDEPFERFRGWLRGITNAAIALAKLQEALDEICALDDKAHERVNSLYSRLNKLAEGALDSDLNTELGIIKDGFSSDAHRIGVPRIEAPLYRDEIGWLLNERGLIALVQGKLYESVPLFHQAITVMRHHDGGGISDPALNASVRRVQLNLGITQIERGNLRKADELLEKLILNDDISGHFGSRVSWIARGYLALIKHISGDFERAKDDYLEVIKRGNDDSMLRLVSIFNRHLADLHRRLHEHSEARYRIELAIAAALQSEQRDVLWLARLTSVTLALSAPERSHDPDPSDYVNGSLRYARAMGLPKLESEALRIRAEIMLHQGDRVLAGEVAAKAAAIARRNGLRLLKLSALSVYGDALIRRKQFKLARDILKEARREAERREYQNQAGRHSELLEQIPAANREKTTWQQADIE